jgi:hypothetical protein
MSDLTTICDAIFTRHFCIKTKRKAPHIEGLFFTKETRLQEVAAHRVPRGQRACNARYFPLFLIETVFADVLLSPAASDTVRTTVTL